MNSQHKIIQVLHQPDRQQKETKYCTCCSEEIVGEVCYGDPWDESLDQTFCSWECIEHCQDQQNMYLDSLYLYT